MDAAEFMEDVTVRLQAALDEAEGRAREMVESAEWRAEKLIHDAEREARKIRAEAQEIRAEAEAEAQDRLTKVREALASLEAVAGTPSAQTRENQSPPRRTRRGHPANSEARPGRAGPCWPH